MLFSSYVDDIAFIKFMSAGPDVACTASGTGCLGFVLFQGGLVFLSLLTGFSLLLGSSF